MILITMTVIALTLLVWSRISYVRICHVESNAIASNHMQLQEKLEINKRGGVPRRSNKNCFMIKKIFCIFEYRIEHILVFQQLKKMFLLGKSKKNASFGKIEKNPAKKGLTGICCNGICLSLRKEWFFFLFYPVRKESWCHSSPTFWSHRTKCLITADRKNNVSQLMSRWSINLLANEDASLLIHRKYFPP